MNIGPSWLRSKAVLAAPVLTALLALSALSARGVEVTVQPYITWVDKTSTTIQWETDVPGTSTVEYGPTGSYGQVASSSGLTTNHKVVVQSLSEENLYHYRTKSEAGAVSAYSSPYTFETAVGQSTPFRFAFMADTRRDGGGPIPLHTEDVANAIYARNPKFTINAGDVTMGNDSMTIETTKQEYRTELFATSTNLMAHKPYFITIGDHERRGVGADQAFATFFSGYQSPYWQHTYYTFTYGNARFVMLDTIITSDHADGVEVPGIAVGSPQHNWLVNVLENNTSDWTFVSHHYSTYQSATRFMARDLEMRALLGPLFDQYGVDMALLGHAHFYERTHPIRNGVRDDENGTIYVTAGIGGASLSPEPPGSALTATKFADWGYCIFNVNGGTVSMTTYDLAGNVRDYLTMPAAANPDDLVGHWTFDDVSGNRVTDSAGGDDTGTLAGGTSIVPSGAPVPGGTTSAASFAGTGQIINIDETGNLAPGTGDWSYAAWFNTVTVAPGVDGDRQELYGEYGPGSNVTQIYLSGDEVAAYWRDGAGSEASLLSDGADVTPNAWHHLALVREGSMLTAYLDGATVGDLDMVEILDFNTAGGNAPVMGAHPLHTGNWAFQGLLDDVRIYSRALSLAEIAELVDGAQEWIPGDANKDGKVTDAAILASNWQRMGDAAWEDGDFNSDGNVTDADAAILASNWQEGVEAAQPVPEPGTTVLLAIGMICLVLSRRLIVT